MAKKSKAKQAGIAVGLAGRAWEYGKKVDWPAVWMRARWLSHHTQRLYNNLTPEERKEFLASLGLDFSSSVKSCPCPDCALAAPGGPISQEPGARRRAELVGPQRNWQQRKHQHDQRRDTDS